MVPTCFLLSAAVLILLVLAAIIWGEALQVRRSDYAPGYLMKRVNVQRLRQMKAAAEELRKLADLKEEGVLTVDEYENLKAKLIA